MLSDIDRLLAALNKMGAPLDGKAEEERIIREG